MSSQVKSTSTKAKQTTTAQVEAGATMPQATPATIPASAPTPPPTPDSPILFLAPPPADANIPSVPDGFEPTTGAAYRGIQPRTSELVALPIAIGDLARFGNYAAVIGATAPPLDEVRQVFEVTNEWSTIRNASTAWDLYSRDQEGIAWRAMRSTMDRLKPAFELAAKTNPSIATTYPGLASLLGAKAVSAQKGAATRKRNRESVAEGKVPTHGIAAKARQKAAAKAALAALEATAGTGAATPAAAAATAVQAAAPVAPAPVAPQASAPAVTAAGGAASNGVTRG
jgi:hypothetical protein